MTRGSGLFVGWYDADPSLQPELDRWHSEEHMRERTGLPGFLSAQRYLSVDRPNRYCVLYRTEDVRTFCLEALS
jgi:hypothetical protein